VNEANKEKIKAYQKAYQKAYYEVNKEKIKCSICKLDYPRNEMRDDICYLCKEEFDE
jgi:uncharacterized membrane protein (DUF106 family)